MKLVQQEKVCTASVDKEMNCATCLEKNSHLAIYVLYATLFLEHLFNLYLNANCNLILIIIIMES